MVERLLPPTVGRSLPFQTYTLMVEIEMVSLVESRDVEEGQPLLLITTQLGKCICLEGKRS